MDGNFISCSIFSILLGVFDTVDVSYRWSLFFSEGTLFIGFNQFLILHIGGKRSTIKVSTLKEMM